ncbi:MAG: hypothetical protein V7K50_14540 [Nostoc sp.]
MAFPHDVKSQGITDLLIAGYSAVGSKLIPIFTIFYVQFLSLLVEFLLPLEITQTIAEILILR